MQGLGTATTKMVSFSKHFGKKELEFSLRLYLNSAYALTGSTEYTKCFLSLDVLFHRNVLILLEVITVCAIQAGRKSQNSSALTSTNAVGEFMAVIHSPLA